MELLICARNLLVCKPLTRSALNYYASRGSSCATAMGWNSAKNLTESTRVLVECHPKRPIGAQDESPQIKYDRGGAYLMNSPKTYT